jgi:hypothetical protein
MSNILEEKFGAILAFPWQKSQSQPDEIIGQWAEDGNRYVISCPEQLRDQLVNLQVQLYAKLDGVNKLRTQLNAEELRIEKVLLT